MTTSTTTSAKRRPNATTPPAPTHRETTLEHHWSPTNYRSQQYSRYPPGVCTTYGSFFVLTWKSAMRACGSQPVKSHINLTICLSVKFRIRIGTSSGEKSARAFKCSLRGSARSLPNVLYDELKGFPAAEKGYNILRCCTAGPQHTATPKTNARPSESRCGPWPPTPHHQPLQARWPKHGANSLRKR